VGQAVSSQTTSSDYEVRPPPSAGGGDASSSADAGSDYEVRAPDFASGGKQGERTFQMGTNGKFVPVPYSRVGDATNAGWMIKPDDLPHYFDLATKDRNQRGKMVVPKTGQAPTSFGDEKYKGAPVTPYSEMAPFQSTGKNVDDWFQTATAPREMNPDTKPVAPTLKANLDAAWNATGNAAKTALNVANRGARFVWGMGAMPGQMYDTAKGLFSADPDTANKAWDSFVAMNPGVQVYERTKQLRDEWKKDPQRAMENAIGDVLGLWMSGEVPEGVKDLKDAVKDKLPKGKPATPGELRKGMLPGLRAGIRNTLGVPEHTDKTVAAFGKDAEAVREKNKVEAEKNRQAEIKAHKDNQEAAQAHQTARDEASKHNAEVLRDRAKRTQATQDLETASQKLERRIDAAQKKAKGADDAAWDAWRKKVGVAETDPTPAVETIGKMRSVMDTEDAAEFQRVIKEASPEADAALLGVRDSIMQNQFPGTTWDKLSAAQKSGIDNVLKSLGFDPTALNAAAPVSAPRLHVWKTQLEYAVRKATRGNVRYAIGQVLDAVRDMESQLSTAAGADKELARARALHGPYMDAFRNSPNVPRTVASEVRAKVTPEFTRDEALEKKIAMLAKFDPSLPNLVDGIRNLQQGLNALPKEAPLRTQLKDNPPPLGTPVKPKLTDPTPPPAVPNLQAENLLFIRQQLRRYGTLGAFVLRGIVGGTLGAAFHGSISGVVTEQLVGWEAVSLLTKALRSERALNWLAKPSVEDMKAIATLPPADAARLRTALNTLADHERKVDPAARKIKIAPEMASWLAGKIGDAAPAIAATGAAQQQLKRDAEQRRPEQPISVTAPDGSKHVFQNQTAADQFKAAAGIQ
jgi:hypothetical protein